MVLTTRRSGWWIALGILSALGVAAGLYMNRQGVDVEIDSAAFITGGIRLAHGEGLSEANQMGVPLPLTWFPPMMSWFISILEVLHLNFRNVFALFNALVWGSLISWTGCLAGKVTGGNILAGLIAAGAVLTSDAIALVCGMLYSEPPFLLWELAVLVFLARWWETPKTRWIWLAGICAAGAFLTRYVGLTLLATGALVILAHPLRGWVWRIITAAVFSVIAGAPVVIWHFWETALRHGDTARALAWHPITRQVVNEGLATLAGFILPDDFAHFPHAQGIILGIVFILVLLAVLKSESALFTKISPLIGISAAFVGIYASFLVVSISVADADTPLDPRILSILVPPGILLATWLGWIAFRQSSARVKSAVLAVVCLLLILQGVATFRNEVARTEITLPPGYTSQTLNAIRALPNNVILYSDHPRLLYMAIRRKSEPLPLVPLQSGSEPARGVNFQEEIAKLQQTLSARGGWVVYWEKIWIGDTIIPEEKLRAAVPVMEARYFDDGVLLKIAPGKR